MLLFSVIKDIMKITEKNIVYLSYPGNNSAIAGFCIIEESSTIVQAQENRIFFVLINAWSTSNSALAGNGSISGPTFKFTMVPKNI